MLASPISMLVADYPDCGAIQILHRHNDPALVDSALVDSALVISSSIHAQTLHCLTGSACLCCLRGGTKITENNLRYQKYAVDLN